MGLCAFVPAVCGQEEEDLLINGMPVENAIVERDWAVRCRLQAELTEEREELIDDDASYARYPSRIYSSDVRLYRKDRSYFDVMYSRWENSQGLDLDQWSWKMRGRLFDTASFVNLQFRRDQTSETENNQSLYLGIDRYLADTVYSFVQYRYRSGADDRTSHQVVGLLTWLVNRGWRLGAQGAVSEDSAIDGTGPWYARAFTTIYLVPDWTSLRVDARYSDSRLDMTSQEYNAYLYQKLGSSAWVRFNYRHYEDSDEFGSNAYGIKFKYFFSTRFSANIAYRYYDQDQDPGAELDTFYGGIDVLF